MPNLLAAIIAFGVMIFVHELGHFLVAKRAGVTVHAFALGFGPRLVGFRYGGTDYAINLLPFGGFVRMAGEDLDTAADDPGSFRRKSVWQRMAVIAAGPGMNLLLSIVLLSALAISIGVPTAVSNRIGTLLPGWPAEQAGLRPGDAIVAIDGHPTATGDQVVDTIHRHPNAALTLTVERGGRRFDIRVTSRLDKARNIGLIGFSPEPIRERMDPVRAVGWSVRSAGETIGAVFTALGRIIRGNSEGLSGPVGAVIFLGEAGQFGAEYFLYTVAAISIMIGIFNLLPFPALDGGRLLFLIVEAFRRRPVDPKREGYIHLVGFALLLLLLVTLTIRDVGARL
ncbi:MAG TPA: M50 family metallopeptidase [bacterium]|jgi:regulator of sigma E protease